MGRITGVSAATTVAPCPHSPRADGSVLTTWLAGGVACHVTGQATSYVVFRRVDLCIVMHVIQGSRLRQS